MSADLNNQLPAQEDELIGLQFPKLDGNWDPVARVYTTACFDDVVFALQHGGQAGSFEYIERALANLIAAAWRDEKWNDILVLTPNLRTARSVTHHVAIVLAVMNIESEISEKTHSDLFSGHRHLSVAPNSRYMRGAQYDHLIILENADTVSSELREAVHIPGETYLLSYDFGDDYLARQAGIVEEHGGHWNANIKMERVGDIPYIKNVGKK